MATDTEARPWPATAIAYSKLIRPFPAKRLADAMYHVQADAATINDVVQGVLRDQPRTAEDWVAELDRLDMLLESLSARCDDARPVLARMVDQADADFERGLRALVAILRDLPVEAEAAAA